MNADERAQLVATQVAEHIRQSVAPIEAAFNQLVAFLRESVEGVYVGDVLISSVELLSAPLDKWGEIVKAKLPELSKVPEAEPEGEVETAGKGEK